MNYSFLKNTLISLVLITLIHLLFIFLNYLLVGEIVGRVLAIIIISLLISLVLILWIEINRQKRLKRLLKNLIDNTDYSDLDKLVNELGLDYQKIIYSYFYKNKSLYTKLEAQRSDLHSYKDIIEKWVHDVKTPIATIELVLENYPQQIEDGVYDKILYSSQLIKSDLDVMLYFARSNTSKIDYDLEKMELMDVVYDVLTDYYPIISEKQIKIKDYMESFEVFTDFYTIKFIISQILNNALKYTKDEIILKTNLSDRHFLEIINNGSKIYQKDLPFIFEKGFTGRSTKNNSSSGLGLYLAKKYARDLGIDIQIISNKDGEFSVGIFFYGKMEENKD